MNIQNGKIQIAVLFLSFFIAGTKAMALQVLCASPSGESLAVTSAADKFTVSYDSGKGPEYAPIEDGPVRQISVAYYNMAYQDLKNILPGFALSWQSTQCDVQAKWWMSSCHGSATVSSDKHDTSIKATSVNFSQIQEEGSSGSQTIYRFRVVFEKNGNTYFVPLSFSKESCRI